MYVCLNVIEHLREILLLQMTMFTANRKRGEGMTVVDMPLLDTPWSRISEKYGGLQNSHCRDLEMDYLRCYGLLGVHMADRNPICQKYMDDFMECSFGNKTVSCQ